MSTGLDTSLPRLRVLMTRVADQPYPRFSLPKGYAFHWFSPGDTEAWLSIQVAVNHFPDRAAAVKRFEADFGQNPDLLQNRMLFVTAPDNQLVATATMWYEDYDGARLNRLHWVAVDPMHQGQRLTHALLTELLVRYNTTPIFLTSYTWSYRGISIYEKFGFKPFSGQASGTLAPLNDADIARDFEAAWQIIQSKIAEVKAPAQP